ncbi:MAG: nucleotidyltransferase domain-containing protein, partial [Candidatus Uhrbacteria bacterium]|nr:nucleotidyltransferase domain-containing protein [Candidatus Uhrbacteria bacterium]
LMKLEKAIQLVRDILRQELPSGYETVLFGSWATGTARPTSDIDIGIVGDQPVPNDRMVEIRAKVEAIQTLRKIEVVDLQTTDERFRQHALEQAKPL